MIPDYTHLPDTLQPYTDSLTDAWDNRLEMGNPFTVVGWRRFCKRVARFYNDGYCPDLLIDLMIRGSQKNPSGWLTVYARDDCKRPRKHRETTVTNIHEVRQDKDKAAAGIQAARKAL